MKQADTLWEEVLGLPLVEAVCRLQEQGYQLSLKFTGPGEEGGVRVVRVKSFFPGRVEVVAARGWKDKPARPEEE